MMTIRDEASELKPWEQREPPNSIAAWTRRILHWTASASIAGALGGVVFILASPVGGGPVYIAAIANLLLGVVLLALFGSRFFTPAISRIVFYSFTAPTWIFLVWLVTHLIRSKT